MEASQHASNIKAMMVNLRNAKATWGMDSAQYKAVKGMVDEAVSLFEDSQLDREGDGVEEVRKLVESLEMKAS